MRKYVRIYNIDTKKRSTSYIRKMEHGSARIVQEIKS